MFLVHVALTAVLLSDPLRGQSAHGAAGLSISGQRPTDLGFAVVVAAVQVTRLEIGPRVQQPVTRLEEAFESGQLLTGILILQCQHRSVVTGLSQSHVLGLITTAHGHNVTCRYSPVFIYQFIF